MMLGDLQPCPDCGHDTSTTPTHNVRPCATCDDAAQVGQYAPCQTGELPAGAIVDDDPEAFAAELEAEYTAAVERIRDRAQEARTRGLNTSHANYLRRARARRDFADEPTFGYARTAGRPILRALSESASGQTRSA